MQNKTRQELKRELIKCKYIPGVSCLPMINTFEQICVKLELLLPVQIAKIIRLLSANLRQFVVSRNTEGFDAITLSVRTYQEMIELDSVSTSTVFKSV